MASNPMTKSILDRYEEAHAAFMRGSVHGESDDQLLEYLSGLANQNNTNTGTETSFVASRSTMSCSSDILTSCKLTLAC